MRLQKVSGKKAMERLKETKKRDSDEGGASPKRHRTTGRLFARENSGCP